MPRRPNTASREELHARLGPGLELVDWEVDGPKRIRSHRGWRWSCACVALLQKDDRYLWLPCRRHELQP